MTMYNLSDAGEDLPTRDFVRADAAADGVFIETREWDGKLRYYRTTTALLTPAEAERLAFAIAVAAKHAGGYRQVNEPGLIESGDEHIHTPSLSS